MLKKGFTLLELMIVVIIMGVLASVAMPYFGSMITKSYKVEAFHNLSAFRTEMEQCLLFTSNDACLCMTQLNTGAFRTELNNSPGAKFQYSVTRCGTSAMDKARYEYVLTATYTPIVMPSSQIFIYVDNFSAPYGTLECGTGLWDDIGTYSGGICI